MAVENGSARFHRRRNSSLSPPTAKKTSKLLPVLLSCCIFFIILCACLLTVLVLIGRHLYDTRNIEVVTDVTTTKDDIVTIIPPQKHLLTRLSNYTLPIHYDITYKPNIITGDFNGNVNITINLTRTSRELVLHSKDLNISSANLFYLNESKVIAIENTQANGTSFESETISFLPQGSQELLLPGIYYLNMDFSGSMLNRFVGVYRSQYKAQNAELRSIVTSKFEPTHARQAFPCFDEPNMKAKFTIHIVKPKNDSSYIALSNMPEMSQDILEDSIMVHFQESVKMSTYLVCLIVCDFKYTENVIETTGYPKVPLRVYATPAQLEKTKFAAECTVGVIKYFINYFSIPYPLPKLDLIAIPDFVSGAMEHWGLVTFRETSLLFDENLSSAENKQRVASVISHELAHSWFGNLVTMNWWNDLWLNEGFASYIQYKGIAAVYPDWQMEDQFLTDTLHSALAIDSTPASHPIVQVVNTPDQITEIFDTITYEKGASILRMLEGAVGETVFQNGVTNYLKAHIYGNAVTQNLWDELQLLVGEKANITDFMNTWTIQMGYPILTVKEDGDKYVLAQQRFLQDADTPGNQSSPYQYKWTIPVTYTTDLKATPELVWFDHTKSSINIPKPQGAKWIKFNHKQLGFYRVNYGVEQWQHLSENAKQLSVADRAHLLEESFSIAESGQLDYSVPLNLTKYLKNELNYISWTVAATKMTKLGRYLQNSLVYGKFQEYIIGILNPVYKKLTWNETSQDGHLERRLRITILALACSMNHPDAVEEAVSRFRNWLKDPAQHFLSQNLRPVVMKYGMVRSGKDDWERALALYKNEIDANEKLNLLRGLAAVKEPWLLQRLIELGKDDKIIRRQDYFIMLQLVADNPIGTPIVWDYVRENWKALVERFTLNDRSFGKLMPFITRRFSTTIKLKELERFFEDYPEAGAGKFARQQALANVRNNIKWISKNKEIVENWIQNNDSSL